MQQERLKRNSKQRKHKVHQFEKFNFISLFKRKERRRLFASIKMITEIEKVVRNLLETLQLSFP